MKKLTTIALALCCVQASAITVNNQTKHKIEVTEEDMGIESLDFKVVINGRPTLPGALVDQFGWGHIGGGMLAMLPAAAVLDDDPQSVTFRNGETGELKAVMVTKDGKTKFLRFDSRGNDGLVYIVREVTPEQAKSEKGWCVDTSEAAGCTIL